MSSRDEHTEISELSGLAALGALAPEDERRVAAHLRSCAICRATFAEQRATADLLLQAPEPIEPSADLKARVMAAVGNEAQPSGVIPRSEATRDRDRGDGRLAPVPDAPVEIPRSARNDTTRRRAWDWRDLGMVASLAAAFYLGYWTLRLQGDVAATQARLSQQEAVVRAATQGRVVQLAATNVAPQVRGAVAESPSGTVVYLDGLPQPAPDRAYEVWLIPPGGQPIGVGLSSAGQGGTQTIPIERGLAGMQTIAITEEPAGGSPGPTTQILAAARL